MLPAGELTFTERLDLGSEYVTLLDADRLDLLDIRLADAMLRREILQGILLFERDPQRVSNFIQATVNELRRNAYRRERAMCDYFQSIAEAYGDDRPHGNKS